MSFRELFIGDNKFHIYEKNKYVLIFSTKCGEKGFKKDTKEGIENIEALREYFGLKEIKYLNQIHSTEVYKNPEVDVDGDGLYTMDTNLGLAVFGADCPTILMIHEECGVIGACHSGWRGTLNCISVNLAHNMVKECKGAIEGLSAYIGPHAHSCCYEVSWDMADKFNEKRIFGGDVAKGRYLSLNKALKSQMVHAGIPVEEIQNLDMCTICNEEFHSYRRDGEESGRNMALIFKRED